ncbi:uncharacterized protein LOC136038175 [Artemia franciscana]|uniref:Uncharacterized protein n=1 Tax=Artemia franciscana TaxID=6661 RepID=A0AA88HZE9_ARTSF|nr:hypothetical protein QYM36_005934 [Artemia franciscana]
MKYILLELQDMTAGVVEPGEESNSYEKEDNISFFGVRIYSLWLQLQMMLWAEATPADGERTPTAEAGEAPVTDTPHAEASSAEAKDTEARPADATPVEEVPVESNRAETLP